MFTLVGAIAQFCQFYSCTFNVYYNSYHKKIECLVMIMLIEWNSVVKNTVFKSIKALVTKSAEYRFHFLSFSVSKKNSTFYVKYTKKKKNAVYHIINIFMKCSLEKLSLFQWFFLTNFVFYHSYWTAVKVRFESTRFALIP